MTNPAGGGVAFADHYHVHPVTAPGDHTAEAVVRAVGGSAEYRQAVRFAV